MIFRFRVLSKLKQYVLNFFWKLKSNQCKQIFVVGDYYKIWLEKKIIKYIKS